MFTGLILGQGRILAVEARGPETRLRIEPLFDLPDPVMGESIAVNGACLTVESLAGQVFGVYASAETMRLTNLGRLRTGHKVNLERALAMGDRLGGHMVSGHVDCLAEVASIEPAGESRVYTLKFPQEHGVYVVRKGSVCLDGISLTINACGPDWLSVNIIPETQRVTTIASWRPGHMVNLETDLIGKYVRRMMTPWLQPGEAAVSEEEYGGITLEFLQKNGF